MKICGLAILFFWISGVHSQDLTSYKYVIVPESFDFSKEKNQYQLNELTAFLFERAGYNVIMKGDEIPEDLRENNCKALIADVENNSNLFVTKFVVTLEDCHGNNVFTSEEGTSREKEYEKGWHEALRDAFSSIENLSYNYEADEVTANVPEENKNAPVDSPETEEQEEEVEQAEVGEQPMGQDQKSTPATEEEIVEKEARAEDRVYVKDDTEFFLERTENGYSLYQKGMAEPFASLVESEKRSNYIYSSVTRQGIAFFDEDQNLIVEYFNRDQNATERTVYELQD